MNVYLIKTPEFEIERFKEVTELLSSIKGPLKFIQSSYEFDINQFDFLNFKDKSICPMDQPRLFKVSDSRKNPKFHNVLDRKELFSLCNFYRDNIGVEGDSFVVLLTKWQNTSFWYSAFNNRNRNIFVYTDEWGEYTKVNEKYPIAYQVVENIIQCLMKLNNMGKSEFIHDPVKGCMNDFCRDKQQIIFKLQTANICEGCVEKFEEENGDLLILTQVKEIISEIREQFISKLPEPKASPIVIEMNGRIYLPKLGCEIKLTPLEKTVYIFYLLNKNENGVSLSDLKKYTAVLTVIYNIFNVTEVNPKHVKNTIDFLVNPASGSFIEKKSKINKKISELLKNKHLANYYRIDGLPEEPLKIHLLQKLIDVRSPQLINLKF